MCGILQWGAVGETGNAGASPTGRGWEPAHELHLRLVYWGAGSCGRPAAAFLSAAQSCSLAAVSAAMTFSLTGRRPALAGEATGVARPLRKWSSLPAEARMRPRKRGEGLKGRDLNSGWNWKTGWVGGSG